MTQHSVRLPWIVLAVLLLVALGCAEEPADTPDPGIELDEEQAAKWARLWEEQQGMALVHQLSRDWLPSDRPLAFEGVTVIPMIGDGPLTHRTVVVEKGRFQQIGTGPVPDSAERIDARGLFMIPGLFESHSHTISSPSQFLVYLTRGVTTLREMDGFPWMLEARAKANSSELLIPNLYVAGHILSHRPWDFYMTGVESVEQAEELVLEQIAAGYDFIKIHNSMPEPMFGAIFAAAREAGVDVAGHIPNEIPIAAAIAAGFHTNEHFKGYIFDETLEITEQDYVEATGGSQMWHTPTFATYHDHLRGDESRELVEQEESLPLVPRWMRAMWRRQSENEVDRLTMLRQSIYPKSREIFTNLRPVTDRFLAGTDTGTYAYLVPGYTLQEEIRIFEELGMPPAEALATATVNPSRAFGLEDRLGTIEVGKQADFVLLEANPLEGTEHLSEIAGVSLRGLLLDREKLDEIHHSLATLFSEESAIPPASHGELERFADQAVDLTSAGWPYPSYALEELAEFLRELGFEELAAKLPSG